MSRPSFKQILAHPSSVFFLLGGMWGIAAIAHPCPTCVAGTSGLIARGAMERVDSAKAWMNRTFSSNMD